jgi:alkylation response protein AidB-like acyl-CoA dehydrogenase
MDVRLSPEQVALRDSAAQVVRRLGPQAVGQLDDAERVAKLDAAVTAAGWRELRGADETGAPWASAVEVALVAEELGRGLADVAYLGPTLAAELRRLTGAAAPTEAETVAFDAGLRSLAGAVDGSVPAGTVAVDAKGATAALVLEAGPSGSRVGQVALPSGEVPVDLTRPSVPFPGPTQVAPLEGRPLADADIARWTALGLALTCADLVGTMRGAVELAREYASSRKQYGVTIGSFQAVQHLMADAHVATEGSRSAALHAAWAVDALPPSEALAAAALAKAYCARAARPVCETAIQVHGGIGNTWECLAHVHLRRALLSSDVLGGADASLDRVLAHHGIGHHETGTAHGLR